LSLAVVRTAPPVPHVPVTSPAITLTPRQARSLSVLIAAEARLVNLRHAGQALAEAGIGTAAASHVLEAPLVEGARCLVINETGQSSPISTSGRLTQLHGVAKSHQIQYAAVGAMEQDPALAAAGSRLTCVVGGVCGDPSPDLVPEHPVQVPDRRPGAALLLPPRPHNLEQGPRR